MIWPFVVTAKHLQSSGYQFDYVSDKLLQEMTIQAGKIRSKGGYSSYKAVVVPACKRIPVETMQKLVEFAKSGVPVIFDQQIPGDVPGLNNVSQRLYELISSTGNHKRYFSSFCCTQYRLSFANIGYP